MRDVGFLEGLLYIISGLYRKHFKGEKLLIVDELPDTVPLKKSEPIELQAYNKFFIPIKKFKFWIN